MANLAAPPNTGLAEVWFGNHLAVNNVFVVPLVPRNSDNESITTITVGPTEPFARQFLPFG